MAKAILGPTFEEMRAIELDERLSAQTRGNWTAWELLEIGTNHASLGFAGVGRIEVGDDEIGGRGQNLPKRFTRVRRHFNFVTQVSNDAGEAAADRLLVIDYQDAVRLGCLHSSCLPHGPCEAAGYQPLHEWGTEASPLSHRPGGPASAAGIAARRDFPGEKVTPLYFR